jgi:hypothetical protein
MKEGRGNFDRINKIKMIVKAGEFFPSAHPINHINPIKKIRSFLQKAQLLIPPAAG